MTDWAALTDRLKQQYDVRIRRWRRTMTGCAWRAFYHDGRTINWVEAPVPKSPVSLAIFLHEIGHHVIGFSTYKRRCEEEHAAWQFALRTMRELGVEPDARTLTRVERSMQYAVDKAVRRGIKGLPESLTAYLPNAA